VGLPDPHAGALALEGAGFSVTRDGDMLHVDGPTNPGDITRLLADQGMYVHELTPVRQDLESVFLQLTMDSSLSATDTVGVA
jgi:ABC-2 type transport system ATP-binding protein